MVCATESTLVVICGKRTELFVELAGAIALAVAILLSIYTLAPAVLKFSLHNPIRLLTAHTSVNSCMLSIDIVD